MAKFQKRDESIYLCDNGRALCGAHLGATAKATGRDLSGQRVHRVTDRDRDEAMRLYGWQIKCERCGRAA